VYFTGATTFGPDLQTPFVSLPLDIIKRTSADRVFETIGLRLLSALFNLNFRPSEDARPPHAAGRQGFLYQNPRAVSRFEVSRFDAAYENNVRLFCYLFVIN
jgi:hypothetical protein